MARNHNFNSYGYSSHGGGGTGGRGRNNHNHLIHTHHNNHRDPTRDGRSTYRHEQQNNDNNQYAHHAPYNRYHHDPYPHSGRPSFRGNLNSLQNEQQHQRDFQDEQVTQRTINPPRSTHPATHPAGIISSAAERKTTTVEYDTEWNRRTRTFEQLMTIPSLNERIERFEELPSTEQLILFFPEDWSPESLPPLQEPTHWPGKIQNALQTCVNKIPELFYSDEQMDYDDDDVDPADEMYAPPRNNGQEYARRFISALPYCHPFLAGFHVLPLLALAGKGTMCYCPCSQKQRMDRWQRFFLPESMLDDPNSFRCTFHGPKSPHELYKHIADVASTCNYHKLLQTFLLTAFADYHQPGMRHIELENKGDFKHKEAQAFVAKEIKKQVDTLAREAKKMRDYEQKLAELKKRQAKLETTNRDLAEQLKAERKLKEKLDAKGEKDFNDSQLQRALTIFNKFKSHIRQGLEDACPNPKSGEVSIVIDQPINVVNLFDKLHSSHVRAKTNKSNFAFLFDSLKTTNQSEDRRRIIKMWTAILKQTESTETMLSLELAIAPDISEDHHDHKPNTLRDKDEVGTLRPKDEGGPTRLFFSRAWDQVGNLEVQAVSVKKPNKIQPIENLNIKMSLKLFSRTRGGLFPEQDMTIEAFCEQSEDPNVTRNHVRAYYIAFGRLLAHAILLGPENRGPLTIAMGVLPDLLKNILFRGLNVSDEAYLLGDVIDHMGAVLDIDREPSEDDKVYEKRVHQYLASQSGEELRKSAQENFIETRKEVLKWIHDGLSIGGRVDWSTCLASVPTKSMTRLLGFSQQKIRYESVFDELGKFRFIKFDTFSEDDDSARFSAKQELFKTRLANWFKEKMKEDATFLSNFVYFCTGSKYMPDIDLNPAWFITVEFNISEMDVNEDETDASVLKNAFVPVVHTCDNCIKIPAHAYDCNMEIFEEKLNVSMKQTLESFDMA